MSDTDQTFGTKVAAAAKSNDMDLLAGVVADDVATGTTLVGDDGNQIIDSKLDSQSNRAQINVKDLIGLTEDAYGVKTTWAGLTNPKESVGTVNIKPDIPLADTFQLVIKLMRRKVDGSYFTGLVEQISPIQSDQPVAGYYATTLNLPLTLKLADLKVGEAKKIPISGVGEGLYKDGNFQVPSISLTLKDDGSLDITNSGGCDLSAPLSDKHSAGYWYNVELAMIRNIGTVGQGVIIPSGTNPDGSTNNASSNSVGVDYQPVNMTDIRRPKRSVDNGSVTFQLTDADLKNSGIAFSLSMQRQTVVKGQSTKTDTIPIKYVPDASKFETDTYLTSSPVPVCVNTSTWSGSFNIPLDGLMEEVTGADDIVAPSISFTLSGNSTSGRSVSDIKVTDGRKLTSKGDMNGYKYHIIIDGVNYFKESNSTNFLDEDTILWQGASNGDSNIPFIKTNSDLTNIKHGIQVYTDSVFYRPGDNTTASVYMHPDGGMVKAVTINSPIKFSKLNLINGKSTIDLTNGNWIQNSQASFGNSSSSIVYKVTLYSGNLYFDQQTNKLYYTTAHFFSDFAQGAKDAWDLVINKITAW